jgi:hypothetical protein
MTFRKAMIITVGIFALLVVCFLILSFHASTGKNGRSAAEQTLAKIPADLLMAAVFTLPFGLIMLAIAYRRLPGWRQAEVDNSFGQLMLLALSAGLFVFGISSTIHQLHLYRTWPDEPEQLTMDEIAARLPEEERLWVEFQDGWLDCSTINHKSNPERLFWKGTEVLYANDAGTVVTRLKYSGHLSCETLESKSRPAGIVTRSSSYSEDYPQALFIDVCTSCSRGRTFLWIVGSILLGAAGVAAFIATLLFLVLGTDQALKVVQRLRQFIKPPVSHGEQSS